MKNQLSVLADLVNPLDEDDEDMLDEAELQVLREAGIIAAQPSKRRRKYMKPKAKHIIFTVEDEEDGAVHLHYMISHSKLTTL